MVHITISQLISIAPGCKKTAKDLIKYINRYFAEFNIDTPLRAVHYLAQAAHESGEFRYLEEIASGKAYEGRKDLGNTQPGDGVKYKGRGLFQLTGRVNYEAYRRYCGFDVVSMPWLLSRPLGAVRSSMWYFSVYKNLLKKADADDVVGITKAINGGYNGLDARKKYLKRAKKVLGV